MEFWSSDGNVFLILSSTDKSFVGREATQTVHNVLPREQNVVNFVVNHEDLMMANDLNARSSVPKSER